jgi:hypothetical protein
LEGNDTRASGIRGNYPLLLKYKNLWISTPGYTAEMFVATADRGQLRSENFSQKSMAN